MDLVEFEEYPRRFIADAMLGSLARWLRVMGYDTLYFKDTTDREIIVQAIKDNRTILTKDHHFLEIKAARFVYFVEEESLSNQLRQVVSDFQLDTETKLFIRCLECNSLLEFVEKNELAGWVPPFVLEHNEKFCRCPGCARIYWAGTHLPEMQQKLLALLGKTKSG